MIKKIAIRIVMAVLMLSISAGIIGCGIQNRSTNVPVMKLSLNDAAKQTAVKSDGTFIQWWLVKDWNDEKWQQELKILKEAQMDYIILEPLAFYNFSPEKDGWVTETAYPSKIAGFKRLDGYRDIVDACLRNAQKAGIKVFLGLNFSDEWWSRRHDAQWINARVSEGNLIANELWHKYKEKYPEAFYGWYWCWETDNIYFKRIDPYNSAEILANALNNFTGYLESKGIRLPVMVSPYMNWFLGTPGGNASLWEYILSKGGFKAGDILCPQDSVGAGGLSLRNFAQWFAELRKAVDKTPGIQLWADTEIFISSDWTAVTVDRFIGQMKALSAYVDNYVTFSYSHYYSPDVTDSGFHKTYLQYLRDGDTEKEAPSVPQDLKFQYDGNGDVILSWTPSFDDTGVCGYYVIRNGKKIANLQVPRTDSWNKPGAATDYTDRQEGRPKNPVYEVQAYDFAGNLSEKSAKVTFSN